MTGPQMTRGVRPLRPPPRYGPGLLIMLTMCSVTTTKTWLRFTRENLCRAQGERQRSAVVRAQCQQLMRREAMELWKQVQLVNRMIAIRVANTNDAAQKLRQHVERVIL